LLGVRKRIKELTIYQSRYLLNILPIGSTIKISVKDCNKILDEKYANKEIKKSLSQIQKNIFCK
jgi:hypothetical protein